MAVNIHYEDGTIKTISGTTPEAAERAKRAVEIMRARRNGQPSDGARRLKEILDRLDAQDAQSKKEHQEWLEQKRIREEAEMRQVMLMMPLHIILLPYYVLRELWRMIRGR